jgi:DHA2 family multidrug resistance protein
VLTSYLAANAVILPITGWLSAHLGRRNYFLLSIAVFTLSSALCGMAGSLGQLILFRVIQGLAGGGLQPSSQGVLLDAFPLEKQGMAMTLFGLAALIAPVVGPTLGGWITDAYDWRWVFLINVPVGLLALAACYAKLRDPDYLIAQRRELRKRPFQFDSIGLSLLVIVMVSLPGSVHEALGRGERCSPGFRMSDRSDTRSAGGTHGLRPPSCRHRGPCVGPSGETRRPAHRPPADPAPCSGH